MRKSGDLLECDFSASPRVMGRVDVFYLQKNGCGDPFGSPQLFLLLFRLLLSPFSIRFVERRIAHWLLKVIGRVPVLTDHRHPDLHSFRFFCHGRLVPPDMA